jgi:hypothetical protein
MRASARATRLGYRVVYRFLVVVLVGGGIVLVGGIILARRSAGSLAALAAGRQLLFGFQLFRAIVVLVS